MLNRVCQGIRAFTGASGRRFYQFALLTGIRPAIGKVGGDAFLVVVILAVMLVAIVIMAAVFSDKPARRRAALSVLDRILRWKA